MDKDMMIESKYFIDGENIMLAEVGHDENADNPVKDDCCAAKVVLSRIGNVNVSFDPMDQDEIAENIPELGEEVLSCKNGISYIDIEKCHKKGIAIIPFCYADNVHGPGTNTFNLTSSFLDTSNL